MLNLGEKVEKEGCGCHLSSLRRQGHLCPRLLGCSLSHSESAVSGHFTLKLISAKQLPTVLHPKQIPFKWERWGSWLHPQNSIHLALWPCFQTAYRLRVNELCETGSTPRWPYLLSALSRKIGLRKLFLIWISAIYNKPFTSVTISILLAIFTFMFQRGETGVPFLSPPYSSSVLGQLALKISDIFLAGMMGDRNKFKIALYTSHILSLWTLRNNSWSGSL